MMIAVVGTRGFPDVQGGVERHCEELYTRLAARGHELVVFTRSPYVPNAPRWSTWRAICFRKVWTPRRKSLEAIWHSVAAVLLARASGIKLVHVHAIGPGLVVPLARLLGMRVVFTHHGRDYMRDKWGAAAKLTLRLGERLAVRYANAVLAVSREVEDWVRQRFHRPVIYAPNGISVAPRSVAEVKATLAGFQLQPGGYAVTVARLVPEKGIHNLIEAVSGSDVPTLVVVGEADHRSLYAAELKARAPEKIRFVGVQPHEVTLDLVRGARVFVLPSYHEGLPIALLEAMACETPVIASRIAPNCEVVTGGVDGWLVDAGDVSQLRLTLQEVWTLGESERSAGVARAAQTVARHFSWDGTVDTVAATYRAVSNPP
jgi:glycosyltransferase involved in cell wall biosynthesis